MRCRDSGALAFAGWSFGSRFELGLRFDSHAKGDPK